MKDGTKYLSTREAAKYLGVSPRTLDRYRVTGGGPVYHLFGTAVRYLKEDLDHWSRTRRRRSTSDDGSGPRPSPAEPSEGGDAPDRKPRPAPQGEER